ncbi:hypothetical protein [uncultured Senegalimassilia sp.]|uniref:hypothetical protein n=1 Tax=uncultured Senegalimassilia sp. TaxID=1714350 RepID=UPI0025CDA618|nr:hypothetical protein [uncultured Senegalimassilia sp.]
MIQSLKTNKLVHGHSVTIEGVNDADGNPVKFVVADVKAMNACIMKRMDRPMKARYEGLYEVQLIPAGKDYRSWYDEAEEALSAMPEQ